ncbi:hypothetical protein [Aurantimonas sp. 22II-16-19i]|uniref:hypothetical protein n=1 Tax=Aurantimonas sp. 22II-16-19i TaxID=1317114 RepID=UPI0009F7C3B3|nr:hypothetical protein [Aurantimonas sp. 22II-16-19i]ORE90953.1 hypothetical protein ATO4_19864 [Aurantimonas sp. 22II-16-19i]
MAGEWKPEYPSQEREPVWVWWDRDEPETGLVGFHTKEDRDRFQKKEPGPYRRRVSADGKTISQLADWQDWMQECRDILKNTRID